MSRLSLKTAETLSKLGKWAALAVQLVGYFPLTSSNCLRRINSTNSFIFTWAGSVLPYYSCVLTAASFSWCLVYFWRYKEFKSFIEFKAPTEVAAYNLMIVTSTMSGIYMKIFGLINGTKYQEFWKLTEELVQKFQHDTTVLTEATTTPRKGFQRIKSSCRLEFLLMIFPVIVHVSVVYGWSTVKSFLDDAANQSLSSWSNTDTQLYLGLAFWTIGALLHVGNGIWMNFFVKIYTECLHLISVDLKLLKFANYDHHSIPNVSVESADMNLDPPEIYSIHPHPHFSVLTNAHKNDLGTFHKNKVWNYNSKLKSILNSLTKVDDSIARFNDFFGNQLLLQVANCVINLLAFSFFACLWMGQGKWSAFLETLVPLYLYGKELLDMGSVAEDLSDAADSVLDAVAEDLLLESLTEDSYLKIQITSVKLCTKPPVISARQFFTINRSLVTSVMSALVTFLVVLVQFQDQDVEDAKEVATSNH